MRFAFKTSPQNTTWDDMLAVWQAADDIDVFESGWTFDHFYPIFSDSTGPCLEGWTTTTALAQATDAAAGRACSSPASTTGTRRCWPTWPATLDIISDGRLELGIGAGWNEEECDAYGIELRPLTERFDRFDEALEVHRRPADQRRPPTSPAGYFQLTDARCEPKPVQRPHPPICIGGTGREAHAAAGRPLRPALEPPRRHRSSSGGAELDVLHEHCADIGRDPAEITTSTHLPLDPDGGPGPLAEQAAAFAEAGLDLGIVYLPPPHDPGRARARSPRRSPTPAEPGRSVVTAGRPPRSRRNSRPGGDAPASRTVAGADPPRLHAIAALDAAASERGS